MPRRQLATLWLLVYNRRALRFGSMNIISGTKLGRYEIRSELGAGGMGEVYLAQDTKLDRKVALKILPPDVAADRPFL